MIPAGLYDMAGVEARVGSKRDRAGRPRSPHTPDELSDEPFRPSARSGRSLSEPDVEDLACICTRAEQWVVAEHLGVAEGGACLSWPYTGQIVESTSMVIGSEPGPAPSDHARVSIAPETLSSWRTWPKLNICGTQSWSFAPRW